MPPNPDSPAEGLPSEEGNVVTIANARRRLERVLGLSGTEHWAAFEIDSQKSREIACLRKWANECDAWLVEARLEDWKGGPGMGEHDLAKIGSRVWKATKEGRFGIWFGAHGRAMGDPVRQIKKLNSATPHQYLSRLALSNEWCRTLPGLTAFDELTRLEGVLTLDDEFSIITSQPCFPHDDDQPDEAELARWLGSQRFRSIAKGIWYRASDDLGLFDIKPSNIIRSGGVLVPVDVIAIRPTGLLGSVIKMIAGD